MCGPSHAIATAFVSAFDDTLNQYAVGTRKGFDLPVRDGIEVTTWLSPVHGAK